MLKFLAGLITGGALSIIIYSLICAGKHGEPTEAELEAWMEHLKNNKTE
jgi:hypothetical protein